MPRVIHKLTARRVETEKRVGKFSDGGGLWLFVTKDGSKRWVFAYERDKRRHEMGLGPVADVGLGKARDLAAGARELLTEGRDPLDARRAAEVEAAEAAKKAELERLGPARFGPFADNYIDTHEEGWKNPKHRQQWRNTIKTYAAPLLDKADAGNQHRRVVCRAEADLAHSAGDGEQAARSHRKHPRCG